MVGSGHRVPERQREGSEVRDDFEGLVLSRRSVDCLTRFPEAPYVALRERLRALRSGLGFTHVSVPTTLLGRVLSGELDLDETVSDTDLRACVDRRLFGGRTLQLGALQRHRRSLGHTLGHILGAWWRLHVKARAPGHYDFAFMVHPRNYADIVRGIPLLRFVPERWARAFVKRLPPHKLADMNGLSNAEGRPMRGVLFGLGWDREMYEQDVRGREERVAEMVHLATRMGIRHVGLGALLPWASRYGHCLDGSLARSEVERSGLPREVWADIFQSIEGVNLYPKPLAEVERRLRAADIAPKNAKVLRRLIRWAHQVRARLTQVTLTTGHPFTVSVIASLVRRIRELHPVEAPLVGIVGAAGSTGSCCALKLASDGATRLLLVDRAKSSGVTSLEQLREEILAVRREAEVTTTTELRDILAADILVVVSSASGTIISGEMLKPGAIVVDDSQPRNVDPEIAKTRDDICILTVLARVEGLNPNFRFDRHTPTTDACFTCAADVALRAMTRSSVSAVGPATMRSIESVEAMAGQMRDATGFRALEPVFFTHERRVVSEDELRRVAALSAR
jgi:predicted amino acid dehydrogenase